MKPRASILPFLALALACAAHGQTYTWTSNLGGSWDTASNWSTNPTLPVFGPDVVVDFSTRNITANRDLNLGSTGKVVGKIKFGDTTGSHSWDIIAQNGPLTLQTTTGQPEIEVVNWRSDITVQLAGNQGFNKTGANTLRLNNTANPITGTILVSAGTLQIRDGSTNTPTVFAAATMADRSLRITGTGSVDLFRLDGSGTQNVTWSLPATTLESGGVLRFRTNNAATYNHSMAANVTIGTGGGIIQNNGGTGVQSITLSGTLTGSGALAYAADATGSTRQLTVSSADNTFSGNWTVSHGGSGTAILRAGASNALGTGTVTLNANGSLLSGMDGSLNSLSGVIMQHAGSSLDLANQSWTNPAASLTVNNGIVQVGSGLLSVGSLTLGGGEIRLTAAAGSNAPVVTAGNANFGGRNMSVALSGSPVGNSFELVRYAGALSNPPVVALNGDAGRLTPAVNNGSGTDDRITLSFTGSVANLVWTGANSNVWDNNTTANFLNGANPDVFRSFDNVTFNDSSTVKTVTLPGSLNAGTVTFDHATAYTLDGTGAIAGPASLVKSGTATLTVNTPNTFFGPVIVNGGKLVLGNAAALGAATAKTVTIGTGAQLDFNGITPGAARAYTYKLQGAGDGSGALVNSQATGLNENAGVLNLELLENATIGGAARFDIGRAGTSTGTILGNGHTLTKTGSNSIFLRGPAENLSVLVTQGTLGVQDSGLALGGATGSVNVSGGATLLVQNGLTIATPLRLQDTAVLTAAGTGNSEWSGPVTLAGNGTVSLPSAPLAITGVVSEDGGAFTLRKEGGNVLTLSGSNTYSGGTVITGGQVNANSDTAFGSGTVTVERDDTAAATLRINLLDAELDNDIVLNSNAPTAGRAMLNTAAGNTLSVINGDITLSRFPTSGGIFSAADGGILRVLGAIWSTNGVNPNARSGIIEIGGGQGNYTVFAHGEGTLRLVSDNAIVPNARVLSAINGTCILDLNGFDQTLSGLSRQNDNSSTITNSAAELAVITINSTIATSFAGTIENGTGGISIVKTGPETFTLGGANTYTGTTTVTGGTLAINGSQQSASGAISVSGATSTLAGSGAVGGDITVADGATLAPGGPATGIFTTGQDTLVQLQTGTKFRVSVNSATAASSQLFLNGDLNIASGVTLEASDIAPTPAAIPVGTKLTLIDYGPLIVQGTFSGLPEGAPLTIGVNGFTISYQDENRVTLTATGVNDPYLAWAANPAFGLISGVNDGFAHDADSDGLTNGLEWILGGNPSLQDASSLVTTTRLPAGGLTVAFTREPDSVAFADLVLEYDADLAAPWNSVAIGAIDSGPDVNGVIVDINDAVTPHQIIVTIPATNEQAGKLFSRLGAQLK